MDGPEIERFPKVMRRFGPSSFRSQIVASTVTLMAVVLVAVTCGVQLVLDVTAQHDINRVLTARSRAVVSIVDATGGDSAALQLQLDPGVRLYDRDGRVVADTIQPSMRAAADRISRSTRVKDVAPNEELRLRALPFTTSHGWRGVAVVSETTTAYERSEFYALLASLIMAGVLLIVSGLVASWVTSQVLRPVAVMAGRARDWSAHDLDERFGLDPNGNELDHLGATLDGLLDRVAGALRAEQRLTSELAHELRTPLAAIQGIAELGEMRGTTDSRASSDYRSIAESARSMSQTIQALLDLARNSTTSPGDVTQLTALVDELRAALPQAIRFEATLTDAPEVAAPPALVLRALLPVVENAGRFASRSVSVSASASASARTVTILVSDDGPGIAPEFTRRLFDVGFAVDGKGTGLGLALARRVSHSLGGSLELADPGGQGRGASFRIVLPRSPAF